MSAYIPAKLTEWLVPFILVALSAFAAYSHNDKDISNRLTAVETQQRSDAPRLQRIEDKLDKVVDKIVGW